jgi:RND superfamily putative drug exporter
MMVFAAFGKFQQAGIGISFSLVIVLLATLTLTAPVLRLAGRWAFWPQRISRGGTGGLSARGNPTQVSTGSKLPVAPLTLNSSPQRGKGGDGSLLQALWEKVAARLERRPGLILFASIAAMLPFAILGWQTHNQLSYGLLTTLPADAPSVMGTKSLQKHFPAGFTGPTTVLVRSDSTNFGDSDGAELIGRLTAWLTEQREDLNLRDVRSRTKPLGITEAATSYLAGVPPARRIGLQGVLRKKAIDRYVSQADALGGKVTQFDLVFDLDPFARESISHLDRLERAVREEFPKHLPTGTQLEFVGSTASIRDLKDVRAADQVRIGVLVCVSIFVILLLLLRKPVVSLYLIVSVLLSYLMAFGATYAVFWLLDPTGFPGLDWKLPMLLFTILVAVGEDYNIFLMARIEEEQRLHGPVKGVTIALATTGRIISSCGLIMAGTFSALIAGSLVSMRQLGFALAFGVLLDTFVIRPVLVPAFLILLHRRGRSVTVPESRSELAG